MTEIWATVILVSIATVGLKAAGPVLLGNRLVSVRLLRVLEMLGPALLSALVVTQTFGSGSHLVLDARTLGVLAAALMILVRAPILSTVIVAAVVTAVARLLL